MDQRTVDAPRSVSRITQEIKDHLESRFSSVSVVGEISNFHRHSSGHLYFSLKDAESTLAAVMFRGSAMGMFFRPGNGMEVICRGAISVYPPRGNYQLIVGEMIPRGEGTLQVAFEKLKRRLHEEGLFDPAKKKPLPAYPKRVALITSPTGAAIRDMVSVIRRRNPSIQLVLLPVQVQGAGAAEQIVDAIGRCNAYGELDVLIVGRGGGSIEDLWAFNEEIVARAIVASRIPVVSAVGHEVDVTIADYAADLRAATPSVAAEIVAPSRQALIDELLGISGKLRKFVDSRAVDARAELVSLIEDRAFQRPQEKLQRRAQHLDEWFDALQRQTDRAVVSEKTRFEALRHRVLARNPDQILRRGYSVVRAYGRLVRSATELTASERVDITFHDGTATGVIDSISTHGKERENPRL